MSTEKVIYENVPYGTVVGRFLYAQPDASDSGLVPDVYATSDLEVKFTPSTRLVRCNGIAYLPKEFTARIDREGYLLGADGDRTLTILATTASGMEPAGWTWTVEINHEGVPPFTFTLPSGSTVDLATVAPVDKTSGVVKIVDSDASAQVTQRLNSIVDLSDRVQGLDQVVREKISGIDQRLANVQNEANKVTQARTNAENAISQARTNAENAVNQLINNARTQANTATAKAAEATSQANTATQKASEATAKAAEAKRDADYVREAIKTHGGIKGDRGEPGPQGQPGEQGPKGNPGPKGDRGEPGAKGDTGQTGPAGHTPVINMRGDQITVDGQIIGPHLTGPQGQPGQPGEQGPQGLRGPTGNPGAQGARGLTGPAGTPGRNVLNTRTNTELKLWVGTKSQYDAISFKDSNTIYLIQE